MWRWKTNPTVSDLQTNRHYRLVECVLPYGARPDRPVLLRITGIPQTYAGIDNRLSLWIAPGQSAAPWAAEQVPEFVREATSDAVLAYTPGPVERVMIYCRPATGADGMVRTVLSPQDRFGNPSTFTQPIQATLLWNATEQAVTIEKPVILALPAPTDSTSPHRTIPWSAAAVPALPAASPPSWWTNSKRNRISWPSVTTPTRWRNRVGSRMMCPSGFRIRFPARWSACAIWKSCRHVTGSTHFYLRALEHAGGIIYASPLFVDVC